MALSTPTPSVQPVTCTTSTREQRVVFLLLPDVHLLDLAGPVQVFHTANELGTQYKLTFCATQPELCSEQGLAFAQLSPLMPVSPGDLVLVPGISLERRTPEDRLLGTETRHWLTEAHAVGAHVTSVCTGAFLLGEAGLLDDRRCTTHWALVQYLQARHPKAKVLDNVLFVHDQGVTTSAGVSSGIDMALEFLEHDQGPLFTAEVARHLVIYLRRNGSQAQSSVYLQYRTHLHPGIHRVQDFLIHNPTVRVSLEQLAAIAHLSTRSLTRAFKQATGITPTQYQQRLKLELATTLLQNPELTVEEIANRCGFDDARHFRRLWRSQFGSPPSTKRSNRVTSYTQSALKSIESKEPLMLQLRPNCECCNKDLPPYSAEAMICSFECTFCRVCADTILQGRCPNCGGDLVHRPTRSPNLLLKYPASTERVYKLEGCSTSA